MSALHKMTAWVRANPDRAIPLALVAVVALSAGLLLLVNHLANQPKVSTPFSIDRPEEPAIQVKTPDGQLAISRRALAAWQEGLASKTMSYPGLRREITRLSPEERERLGRTPVSFCRERLKDKELDKTPFDPGRPLDNACITVLSSQLPQLKRQLATGLLALAGHKGRFTKSELQAAYRQAYKDLRLQADAETDSQALSSLGLTADEVELRARMQLAQDELIASLGDIDGESLRREYERHPERYTSDELYRPTVYYLGDSKSAEQAYEILKGGGSAGDLKSRGLNFSVIDDRWMGDRSLPRDDFIALSQAGPGDILKPRFIDPAWMIFVGGERRPSRQLTFSQARDDIRERLEDRNARELQDRLERIADRYDAQNLLGGS